MKKKNCIRSIQWNIIQQQKETNYWYIVRYIWTSKTYAMFKKKSRFHMYELFRKGKCMETENSIWVCDRDMKDHKLAGRSSWNYSRCCLVTKLCLTFVTPGMVACQASLSMGFSRQENWSGLPFLSQGDLPGNKPTSPALAGGFFTTETLGIQI